MPPPPVFAASRVEKTLEPAERPPGCPACRAAAAAPLGAPFVGKVRRLWRRSSFEERLYRCAEGHVYSVRVERSGRGEAVSSELFESVDDWLRARTGAEPPDRPPGL
jgi:hypothetical protein